MVKGWAIIGVTFIHAETLGPSRWMTLLFLQAVPVFLILFGTNSIQWFHHHDGPGVMRTWALRCLRRILVPTWSAIAAWWLLVALLQPGLRHVKITAGLPFLHLMGYFKWVGMSWFVTVILELALVFPLLAAFTRRFGPVALVAVGALVALPLQFEARALRDLIGLEAWFVFGPRLLLDVAFGIYLARWLPRIPVRVALAAFAALALMAPALEQISLVGLVELARRFHTTPLVIVQLQRVVDHLWALPLTLALLFVMQAIAAGARTDAFGGQALALGVARPLAWLGRHSWGLYLGQMVTHNGLVYWFDGHCNFGGCSGPLYEDLSRPEHTLLLAAGSFVVLGLGHALLALLDRLRAAGVPLPELRV